MLKIGMYCPRIGQQTRHGEKQSARRKLHGRLRLRLKLMVMLWVRVRM